MDNTAPEISVIIAAYNVQNYIARAVQSALDQQSVSVEVVVVDDLSTDGTADIVSKIHDPRVKLIKLEKNSGAGGARNTAIKAATAPWIAVLDGDDAFAAGRLQRCLQIAKQTNADIVVDNLEVRNEADGARTNMFQSKDFGNKPILDLPTFIAGNSQFLGGTSLGYLKPVFSNPFLNRHQITYDPAIRIGEDYMLMAEMLANGAKCAVDLTAGYSYTVRAGSTSHRFSEEDARRIQQGDAKFLAKYKLDEVSFKAQEKRSQNLALALAFSRLVMALKNKNFVEACNILLARPAVLIPLWQPIKKRLFIG